MLLQNALYFDAWRWCVSASSTFLRGWAACGAVRRTATLLVL